MTTVMNVPGFKMPDNVPIHPLLLKLEHSTGSENLFHHNLTRQLVYTDGVQILAKEAGCYWLLDIIASVIMTDPVVAAVEDRLVHVTTKDNKGAVVIYGDENDEGIRQPIYTQHLPYTDFPFESFHMKFQKTYVGSPGNEKIRDILFLFSED